MKFFGRKFFFNDGVLKGVIFHKGKLLSEVIVSKIEDEREYFINILDIL
ncbi:hypothetical protein OLS72_04105 [Campylobacter jejuni]|nr:hypothetical protein [Campylobacter jejuni]